MTWTKTSDTFPDDLMGLSDAAYRLHHAATTYSNRIGSDGRILKVRLSLVSVPARTRRKAVIAELVEGGYWEDAGDAYELTDFFMDQLSAEEVALTREYNRVRQAIRLAKDDGKRASFKDEERTVLGDLQAAREHRRTLSRSANGSAIHKYPLRPVPAPSRPAPKRGRGRERDGGPSALLTGAPAAETTNGQDVCPECHHPLVSDPDGCRLAWHMNVYGMAIGPSYRVGNA